MIPPTVSPAVLPVDEDAIPDGEDMSPRLRTLDDAVSELRKKYSFYEILFAVVDALEDEDGEVFRPEESWLLSVARSSLSGEHRQGMLPSLSGLLAEGSLHLLVLKSILYVVGSALVRWSR